MKKADWALRNENCKHDLRCEPAPGLMLRADPLCPVHQAPASSDTQAPVCPAPFTHASDSLTFSACLSPSATGGQQTPVRPHNV